MSMSVPQGCKTPKRDRESYDLTVADIRFMIGQANKISKMCSYYVNMPENRTGELSIAFNSEKGYNLFEELCRKINDIQTTLEDVEWRCY